MKHLALLLAIAATGCKKKPADEHKPEAVAAEAPPAPPPPPESAPPKPDNPDKHTCADWGGTPGDGTDCKMTGRAPFTVAFSGTFAKDVFGAESPVWNITNNFDHAVASGEISVWYYDAAGAIVELTGNSGKLKQFRTGGSGTFQVKNQPLRANETRQFAAGMDKAKLPPTVKSFEAEVTAWGWDEFGALKAIEPRVRFKPYAEKTGNDALEARPSGGWK